jgi:hypothetical protein
MKTKQPKAGEFWAADKRVVVQVLQTKKSRYWLAPVQVPPGSKPMTRAELADHFRAHGYQKVGSTHLLKITS